MQFRPLKRREVLTLLGGAAAWPVAAPAQQATTPVVGFLHARGPETAVAQVEAFRRGLAESGFVDGQNMRIEFRWARGQYDQLPAMAAELVRRPVDLLIGGSEPAALAAKMGEPRRRPRRFPSCSRSMQTRWDWGTSLASRGRVGTSPARRCC